MSLPDLDDDRQGRAGRRLREETILWLTTVRGDGQPQTSPVGFLWDGERFLILSEPAAQKITNIRTNPRVSLHLELEHDPVDGGVLTVEGTATLEAGRLRGSARTAYLERFGPQMEAEGLDRDEVFDAFSAVIRVTPTRARSY